VALVTIPARYCSGGAHKIRDRWLPLVEQLCKDFHVLVSSGYRTAAQNHEAGGAANSDHLRGDAADFVGSAPERAALWKHAVPLFPYVEPQAQSANHVHISFAHGGVTTPVGGEIKHIKSLAHAAAVRALVAACRRHIVDWKAAAAVAFEEGASGLIGDHGYSYGPWMLHSALDPASHGGALPHRWAVLGPNAAKTLAWAWSRPGFEYAIAGMAKAGARGKVGHAAVHAIVYSFEGPAKPAPETANAILQFDFLVAQGGNAEAAAAAWFNGPRFSATAPLVTPSAPSIGVTAPRPPGVAKAWRGVIHAAGQSPREQETTARKLAASLVEIIKG
jgi:hypothetical protein